MANEENTVDGFDGADRQPEAGGHSNGLPGGDTPVRMNTLNVPENVSDMGAEKAFLLAACRAAMEAYRHAHRDLMAGSSAEIVDVG